MLAFVLWIFFFHRGEAQPSKSPCLDGNTAWNTFLTGYSKGYPLFSSTAIDSIPGVGRTIHVDEEPYIDRKKLYRTIVYPDGMKRIGMEAILSFVVLISESGRCTEAFVECARGRGTILTKRDFEEFHSSAMNGLKSAAFLPGKKDGKAVRCWMSVPVNFQLR
jgi:hypothetical protein